MATRFHDVYESLPATGWLTRAEAKLLWSAAIAQTGPILEVGSYHGRSTVLLAATGRDVYAVDPFGGFSTEDPSGDDTYRALVENLHTRAIGNVTIFRYRIEDWHIRPVTMAYLDGDHTPKGTARQVSIALRAGARIIAMHDVNDSGDGLLIKKVAEGALGQHYKREGRMAVWELQ
jgi:hypothetical protein